MFSGIIKEYPDSVLLEGAQEMGEYFYFAAANYLIRLNPDLGERILFKKNGAIDSMRFGQGGLHICYTSYDKNKNGNLPKIYEFVDLFQTGKKRELPEECVSIGVGRIHGDYCIAIYEDESRIYNIVVHELATGIIKSTPSSYGRVSTDGGRVYFMSTREGLRCYDFDLKMLWEQPFKNKNAFSGPLWPMFHDELVIVNQGVDRPFQDKDCRKYGLAGKIAAYTKKDGSPAWTREFERGVICNLIDGTLYTTHNGAILCIDPRNGAALKEFHDVVEDPHPYDRVWSDGTFLFYLALYERKIVVLDEAGMVLQMLEVPGPYVPPANNETFCRYKDCYLLPLTISSRFQASYAMLVLRPGGKAGSSAIPCEARPEHEIQCLDVPDDKQEYLVTIKDNNIDNILRYGKILMNECALFNGRHIWSNGGENKKFNGLIRLKAVMKNYDRHRSAIREMLEEFEKERAIHGTFSGDGRKGISTKLEE